MPSEIDANAIIAAYDSERLFETILEHAQRAQEGDQFRSRVISLHNDGRINLLSPTRFRTLEEMEPGEFFRLQNFFYEIIPELRASVQEMMALVKALVKKGGQDLAATLPNDSFRRWCEKDQSRVREIVTAAQNSSPLAIDHLTFALVAGARTKDATNFAKNFSDERRLCGITALGRIEYSSITHAMEALVSLAEIIAHEKDDALLANILTASFNIKKGVSDIDYEMLAGIVEQVTAHPGPHVNFACAHVLLEHGQVLPEVQLSAVFDPLQLLDPSHQRTIEVLDVALGQMLGSKNADHAIEFITALLSSRDEFTLGKFDNFGHHLSTTPRQYEKALVTWLLSGVKSLCEGITALSSGRERSEQPINIDLSSFRLSAAQQRFFCRKAIAYFFIQPVMACSIAVSVLRTCDKSIKTEIIELLFDPMLRSYSGKPKDYLTSIAPDDAAYDAVQTALMKAHEYAQQVFSLGTMKELFPSEAQRQIAFVKDADEMRKIQKDAVGQSQLLSLIKRSVVLHGKRTLSFVKDGGSRRPMEMNLGLHEFAFELPKLDIIDPIGLSYLLLVFRAEKLEE